jgi:hypothetical protein
VADVHRVGDEVAGLRHSTRILRKCFLARCGLSVLALPLLRSSLEVRQQCPLERTNQRFAVTVALARARARGGRKKGLRLSTVCPPASRLKFLQKRARTVVALTCRRPLTIPMPIVSLLPRGEMKAAHAPLRVQ